MFYQNRANFGSAHILWVAFIVEEDKSSDPTDVGLFGANGVVFAAYGIADASEQDVKEAEVQLVNVYNLPQDVDLIIERIVITFDEEIASSCATPDCQVAGTSVSNSAGHFLLCNSVRRPSLGGAQPAWRQ